MVGTQAGCAGEELRGDCDANHPWFQEKRVDVHCGGPGTIRVSPRGDGLGCAPPACENAALVYYQAFIASERVRDRWHIKIDGFNGGQELTEDIRKLVTQDTFRYPIELAKAAMQIPVCDWGLLSSGPYRGDKLVDDKARGLATLFSTDGRFLAFEGQYRPALERAGELGRLASHVGDDTYFMWMTSVRVNSRAFRLVQDCPGRDAAGWIL